MEIGILPFIDGCFQVLLCITPLGQGKFNQSSTTYGQFMHNNLTWKMFRDHENETT